MPDNNDDAMIAIIVNITISVLQILDLKKKQESQVQLLKQKQRSDEAAKRLQDEIQSIKAQKVLAFWFFNDVVFIHCFIFCYLIFWDDAANSF